MANEQTDQEFYTVTTRLGGAGGIMIPTEATESEKAIISLALQSYSFLFVGTRTFAEFADLIADVYSMSNPQNAAVVATLRKFAGPRTEAPHQNGE